MSTPSLSTDWKKIALVDALLLTVVFFIPALSHLTPFPLYVLDPMRLVMFAGLILTRHQTNALLLAIVIPMVSTLISGHPPFYKAILISIELAANLLMFTYAQGRWPRYTIGVLIGSIVLSKVLYYAFKFVFIQAQLVSGPLVSTPLYIQLLTASLVTAAVFYFFRKKG
jgi:hypothetical protein